MIIQCHTTRNPIPPMPYHQRKQKREKLQEDVAEKLWKRWRSTNTI